MSRGTPAGGGGGGADAADAAANAASLLDGAPDAGPLETPYGVGFRTYPEWLEYLQSGAPGAPAAPTARPWPRPICRPGGGGARGARRLEPAAHGYAGMSGGTHAAHQHVLPRSMCGSRAVW